MASVHLQNDSKADVVCPSDSPNKERLDLCKYLYNLGERNYLYQEDEITSNIINFSVSLGLGLCWNTRSRMEKGREAALMISECFQGIFTPPLS